MKKRFLPLALGLLLCLLTGCREKEIIQENENEYLIAISLSNVMEPWLSQTNDSMNEEPL